MREGFHRYLLTLGSHDIACNPFLAHYFALMASSPNIEVKKAPILWQPHRPNKPEKSEGGKRFRLVSEFEPKGDQPKAIEELCAGLNSIERDQVLLGVTGSGKTFTMAKIIEQTQRPALIMAPNKTLAAQLYSEFKSFFPDNAVEYFVSVSYTHLTLPTICSV